MSKKETRRAIRQAFPKAKTPAPAKGKAGARVRSAGAGGGRGALQRTVRPPSWKRSFVIGAIMAVLYFLFISYVWKFGGTTKAGNAIISLGTFFLFAAAIYFSDRFRYQRHLRKQKGPFR